MRPKLSILTDPMPLGNQFIKQWLFIFLRIIRNFIIPPKQNFNRSKFRGHPSVTRSLVEGLNKLKYSFNYNPKLKFKLSKNVLVLSGTETLKQAILFKKKGFIDKLYAGPNIVVFASDCDHILNSKYIDVVVTPCDWVNNVYLEDCPSLINKLYVWPAGVDTLFWSPKLVRLSSKKILIFEKQNKGKVGPVNPYVKFLIEKGYEVNLMKYGNFIHNDYLENLRDSILMIGFVTDESQGIAWAEAWSCNVPTLLWRNTSHVYEGRRYNCSTAPYLNSKNGEFFDNLDDFKLKFDKFVSKQYEFSPRDWVLQNMSDEVCANKIYSKILNIS